MRSLNVGAESSGENSRGASSITRLPGKLPPLVNPEIFGATFQLIRFLALTNVRKSVRDTVAASDLGGFRRSLHEEF